MPEADIVATTEQPATVASLTLDLRRLGLGEGMAVMVHSSLSRLGWVCGGAEAVVLALIETLGPAGTIAMPTHSGGRSDPADWQAPAVPEAWWATIRTEMPPFDPRLTPTRKMGAVVECFRHLDDAARSGHPSLSVAARGRHARQITQGHELANGMGEGSPLARLYELDAHVLLLGVGHSNNTSLHLAEYRTSSAPPRKQHSAPVRVNGERRWATYDDIDHSADDFTAIGAAFGETGRETAGAVGAGTGRLMRQREIVDFAVRWMDQHR